MAQQDLRILTREEATTVQRPKNGPWIWPEVVGVAISDSWSVDNGTLSSGRAVNGDPLPEAWAVRFFETLYDKGYVIVNMFGGEAR